MSVISIKNIDNLEYEILPQDSIPYMADSWHYVPINHIDETVVIYQFNLHREGYAKEFSQFLIDTKKYPIWRKDFVSEKYFISFGRRTGIDIRVLDDFYSKYKRETSINSILS